MGSCQDFAPLLTQLSTQFHCIGVDLPGHGQTIATDDDIPGTAQCLVELLESLLGDRPCGLVGYSLGGRIALYLALHYPHRWTKVVLESASAGLASPVARQARQKQDLAIARQLRQPDLDWAEFIKQWYQQTVFQGLSNHPNFSELITQRLQNRPLALAKSLENTGLGSQPYLGDMLITNQIPLLFLAGEEDDKFVKINQELAASCPTAELWIVSNCSHNIHYQQPQQWIQGVQRWFS
jgi:2-succinyl-6-hydroxy-2,4-cyclohexadiene-1-carboxylate synthase